MFDELSIMDAAGYGLSTIVGVCFAPIWIPLAALGYGINAAVEYFKAKERKLRNLEYDLAYEKESNLRLRTQNEKLLMEKANETK